MVRSSDSVAVPAYLALGCVGMLVSSPAYAAASADSDLAVEAAAIVVTGERQSELESPKATAPLRDTPQTVTVISDQVLKKQNLLTLREALAVIPGITFGAGEGGGGYGDSINLRGFSANNDITQDGVRDSAQYSRTDPFNLQQIEVYNGANSVFNGSGSVGGTINLVSKEAGRGDLTILNAAVGTDAYYRASIDSNVEVGGDAAVRLNAMIHRNDVPGRDVERFRRWGVAPSLRLGLGGPTSLTLSYVHQRDDNVPVYGVPWFRGPLTDGVLPGVDDSDYYGIVNLDDQETTVDRLTATFRHAFSDELSVRNLTRWQRVGQYTQTSAPQGTFCLASTGRQPVGANGAATTGLPCPAGLQPGFFNPSGPRGLIRDQVNDLLYNQTDLRWETGAKGGVRNTMVAGVALTQEDYAITTASLPRNADGSAVVLPPIAISDPDTRYTGPINRTVTGRARSATSNAAAYLFDTLELGDHVELNGGVRYEVVRSHFRNLPLAVIPPGNTAVTLDPQRTREALFSYRIGAVFKPVQSVSLYAAFANAKTPSSATVRLGCTSGTFGTATFVNFCDVAPETARNYEIGAKADLFGRKLQMTAALFRNERSNYRTPVNDPAQPAGLQVLDGRSRVDGVALGLSGNITPAWSIFANYTYLDSRVLQSVSDFCLANPGPACLNSAAVRDPQAGDRLIQTPDHSGSLFTTYRLPFGLELGYGLTYQGSFATNQSVLANRTQYRVDDYLIHRAFLGYSFANGLTAQLNVQNVTNERYYTGVRNNVNATTGAVTGGWATPGDARSATLSLFYSF